MLIPIIIYYALAQGHTIEEKEPNRIAKLDKITYIPQSDAPEFF